MIKHTLVALGFMTAMSAPAFATGLQATQLVEVAQITTDADGNEVKTFEQANEIVPGDELRYRLSYANSGEADALDVNLVMPVPAEMNFIEGSAVTDGTKVSYSVDNGTSFSERGNLRILIDGKERIATSEEITHIRWTFTQAIKPDQVGEVSFRGVLK